MSGIRRAFLKQCSESRVGEREVVFELAPPHGRRFVFVTPRCWRPTSQRDHAHDEPAARADLHPYQQPRHMVGFEATISSQPFPVGFEKNLRRPSIWSIPRCWAAGASCLSPRPHPRTTRALSGWRWTLPPGLASLRIPRAGHRGTSSARLRASAPKKEAPRRSMGRRRVRRWAARVPPGTLESGRPAPALIINYTRKRKRARRPASPRGVEHTRERSNSARELRAKVPESATWCFLRTAGKTGPARRSFDLARSSAGGTASKHRQQRRQWMRLRYADDMRIEADFLRSLQRGFRFRKLARIRPAGGFAFQPRAPTHNRPRGIGVPFFFFVSTESCRRTVPCATIGGMSARVASRRPGNRLVPIRVQARRRWSRRGNLRTLAQASFAFGFCRSGQHGARRGRDVQLSWSPTSSWISRARNQGITRYL